MTRNIMIYSLMMMMVIATPNKLDASQSVNLVRGSVEKISVNNASENILLAKIRLKSKSISKGVKSGSGKGRTILVIPGFGGEKGMRLKRIVKYIHKLQDAIKNFRSKYKGYPGDLLIAQASALNFRLDERRNEKVKGNHRIDSSESEEAWTNLIDAKLLTRRPKADSDVGYSIVNYSAYNIRGNAIIVGNRGSNGLYNAGALTPKEASSLYHALKGYSTVIMNGEGQDDCVVNGKYNTSSKKKSCSLVVWIK